MNEFMFASGVGIVLLVFQTTAMGFVVPVEYKPDLVLILVVWAGLRITFLSGVCFAFAIGIFVDLLSGSPTGLFALIYCLVFVSCVQFDATFDIKRPLSRTILVFGSAFAAALGVLLVRRLSGSIGIGWNVFAWMVGKSIIAAVAALPAFPLLDRAYSVFARLAGVR